MDDTRTPVEDRPVEVINTGEELLLRAKVVARQIEERVWRAMEGHGLPPPHPSLTGPPGSNSATYPDRAGGLIGRASRQ